MSEPITYAARVLFPVASPPLARGTITVAGTTITAVEPHGTRAPDIDLGNVAIIPGLVNCHTHLDLRGARGKIPPTDADHFTDWLRGVIAYRRSRSPDEVQADIRAGLAECLRFGTTLVGDITAGGASWDAVAAADLRAVVFYELIALAFDSGQDAYFTAGAWLQEHSPHELCSAGLSPHAPYTVRRSFFAAAGELCRSQRYPLAVHLAESPAEVELIQGRRGPFVDFLTALNLYDPAGLVSDFEQVIESCRTTNPELFVHANYLSPTTHMPPNASLVYCPRTHAAFGHPRHPFREFQARGVRVALGTDSLASNPDLDLLAEARFVRTIRPEVPCDELLRMATLTGAEALGWADETGSLEAGKSADFVAVPLPARDADDPHDLLFGDDLPAAERRTLFRGRWRS